jgi:sodium transport system ATP-binding protein
MGSSDAALVKATGLTRDFGPQRAVDGVSFSIGKGEVVGLLGPNGAGKTTTLRMLAGLITPTSGTAELCGIDVAKDPLEARKHLGFMTASTGLHERLTPRETLATFGALHGLDEAAIAARTEALTAELDLKSFLDKRCGTLSSGQKQRVGIARALVGDPSVVVLDEPTAALDPLASDAILELVKASQARGRAVLFSTHRMEEAEYLCQRLYFLREGKVVAEGSPALLREQSGQPTLTGAFLHYARARA